MSDKWAGQINVLWKKTCTYYIQLLCIHIHPLYSRRHYFRRWHHQTPNAYIYICADFWMAVVRASAFPLDRVMFSQWQTASPLIVAADGPDIGITKTSSAVTTASTRMAVVVVDNRSVDGVFADLSFSDCLRMVRGIAKVVGTRRLICQHCFYYGCFYYYCHCDRHCLLMLNPPWIVKIRSCLKAEDFLRLP